MLCDLICDILYLQKLFYIPQIFLNSNDPNILALVLERLKFLIANHELIFGIMANFYRMYDVFDIPVDFDPNFIHELTRDLGNNLFYIYREIEQRLNITESNLPIH